MRNSIKKILILFSILIFLVILNCIIILSPDTSEEPDLSSIYEIEPDIQNCYEGIIFDSEKQKVINLLNYIRKLHLLKPTIYNYSDDVYASKAALIIAANAELNHYPDSSYECWSKEGAFGCSQSNILMAGYVGSYDLQNSEESIVGFLIDYDVESIGHRRWLLDPFLKYIAFGRVDGEPLVKSSWYVTGMTLFLNDENQDISDSNIEFIAYPFREYPKSLFKEDWYMSFSVLVNKNDFWGNEEVDFSNVIIEIRRSDRKNLSVYSIKYNNYAYGLPNSLQWKVKGVEANRRYVITIKNVKVLKTLKNYEYYFRLR